MGSALRSVSSSRIKFLINSLAQADLFDILPLQFAVFFPCIYCTLLSLIRLSMHDSAAAYKCIRSHDVFFCVKLLNRLCVGE